MQYFMDPDGNYTSLDDEQDREIDDTSFNEDSDNEL